MKSIAEYLRWVLVLPAALTGCVLSMYVAKACMGTYWFNDTLVDIFKTGAGGFGVVWFGALVAPRYRNFVAWVLSALLLVFYTFSITNIWHRYVVSQSELFWGVTASIAGVLGAVMGAFIIMEKEAQRAAQDKHHKRELIRKAIATWKP